MSEHFKFHHGVQEVVPPQAQYAFPSQANRSTKSTVKIQPKTTGDYTPTNKTIRIDLPASGYLNGSRSVLAFDVTLPEIPAIASGCTGNDVFGQSRYIPNNVQSLIRRIRISYGSLVLEDIDNYNTIVTSITNHTVNENHFAGFAEGIEGVSNRLSQSVSSTAADSRAAVAAVTRRYAVNLMSGILNSAKLIPLKWMSSQLTIQIELDGADVIVSNVTSDAAGTTALANNYTVSNVEYIAELLEFDSAYDQAFFKALNETGIPIKFQSWHYFAYNLSSGITSANLQVQERSRSVRLAIAVVRAQSLAASQDSVSDTYKANMSEYQWRIGGKYFPSQPVKCADAEIGEAYYEVQKALHTIGDYESGTGSLSLTTFQNNKTGITTAYDTNVASRTENDARFMVATDLTTSAGIGMDINGLNAEEQSDLSLQLKFSSGVPAAVPETTGSAPLCMVYVMYDSMMVVRPNNQVDLIS